MKRPRYFVRRLIRAGRKPEALYVYRIAFDPAPRVEVYDVVAHAWRARPLEPLYRWAGIIDGEIGVNEIDAEEAAGVIHELEFGRGAGRRRGPERLRPRRAA